MRRARVILSVAGFGLFAFAVGLFSGPGLKWQLWAAGALGLLAYNFGYPVLRFSRTPRSVDGAVREASIQAQNACVRPGGAKDAAAGLRRDPQRATASTLLEELPQSPYGLAVLDPERRALWCNSTAAAHLGIDGRKDLDRPLTELVRHPALAAYLAAGNFSRSLRVRPADAGAPMVSVRCVPYTGSRWLLVSRNVERAERIEIMRRECIANASHELRRPLTVLTGFLETVRELRLAPGLSGDYLDRMEEQCRRMQRIIEDLLRLATLESAPEPSRDEHVGVAGLLGRVRAEVESLSEGRHCIVLEAEDGFDLVGAEGEIYSVFGNLAANAVRYTPPGGIVRLVWRASPAGAEFAVEDTGIGIREDHIPRLTERFYRVDPAGSRGSGGTGLGLAIVKQALARHQATLAIESEPGRGSRFTARFPAHRVVAARSVTTETRPFMVTPAARP
jgi:two-component system phosphate regulon sensor histidine kinase PhoR